VSNAIKYKSDERDLSIKIQVVEESNWYVLSVKDNGIGINLDKYEDKVFGLFKRAHDHVEGSGFGLYMVKNVIEKEGGKITVDSVLNEGTTFNVYFKK
jgi:signal transduction histidine kinase